MERHLLIDTSIWVSLLSDGEEGRLLRLLEKYVNAGCIKLLVPAVLLKEWSSKKLKTFEVIKKSYKDSKRSFSTPVGRLLSGQLNIQLDQVQKKIKKIDALLTGGIQIKISQKVKVLTVDRQDAKKAPFHIDSNSTRDCQLYFSVVEYAQKKNINRFVFVANDEDFAEPGDRNKLHPELVIDDLETQYYTTLNRALHELQIQSSVLQRSDISTYDDSKNLILLERNSRTILDYTYEVLMHCGEQVEFIPPEILCRIEPFRTIHGNKTYSYYSGFTLATNNEELIELLSSINIGATVAFKPGSQYKNSRANVEKATFIIHTLNTNLVSSVKSVNTQAVVSIGRNIPNSCECARCSYAKLNFSTAIIRNNLTQDTIREQLKSAYVSFCLAHFRRSFDQYFTLYKIAKEKHLPVISFICALNVQWLNTFVETYTTHPSPEIQELKQIDLDHEYYSCMTGSPLEREIGSYLHKNTYIYHRANEISEAFDSVRKHYELQLWGGFSQNSNYLLLINHHARFHEFVTRNGLAFSKFSDFFDLFDKFLEGVFMSYALNSYQDSRLLYFPDYVLVQAIHYAKVEKLLQYFNRYVSTDIRYQPDEPKSVFYECVENFFSSAASFESLQKERIEGLDEFGRKRDDMFWNIVVLLSIVDLDRAFIQKISQQLLLFLGQERGWGYNVRYLAVFIERRGDWFTIETLRAFLNMCIAKSVFHENVIFSAFGKAHKRGKPALVSTDIAFTKLTSCFYEKCLYCNSYHMDALLELWHVMSKRYQSLVKKHLLNKLDSVFDKSTYYHAAIRDIIDYKKYFRKYIGMFVVPEKTIYSNPFIRGEISLNHLNELVNLSLKNNVRLPRQLIEDFTGISDYYDWLLNMHGFDYKKFNPLWIMQYPTNYYLRKIFSVKKARLAVKTYLLVNHQPTLAKYFTVFTNDSCPRT